MLAYAGRWTLRSARLELGALLVELPDLVGAALSKKAELSDELHGDPIFVDGDEDQLLQVFLNLVTNAAEALGDKAGKIVVSTELEEYDAAALAAYAGRLGARLGSYVRLEVRDTGCGMDEETRGRVFDPFFTTKLTGRGLGLAAVKGIVLRHRGFIRLESAPGEGTTFTVHLPVVAGDVDEDPRAREGVPEASRKRVLLVDDEESLRMILSQRLEHSGFDVIEAADGLQAIEAFREHSESIDCVLLDLSMPKYGGEEVYQSLRALQEDLPIVLMSGYSEQEIHGRFAGV